MRETIMPKNTYTDEFKADAVRLYETTEGTSFSSISADLGISRATLKNWVYAAVKSWEVVFLPFDKTGCMTVSGTVTSPMLSPAHAATS